MIIKEPTELEHLAKLLKNSFKEGDVVLLDGEVGAGKTTLIKAICREYDIHDVSSPTYSIVNLYEGNINVAHVDAYRINQDDLNWYDIFDQNLTFIEWSENIDQFLPKDVYKITIENNFDYSRKLKFNDKMRRKLNDINN